MTHECDAVSEGPLNSMESSKGQSDESLPIRAGKSKVGVLAGLAIAEQGIKGVANLLSIMAVGRWCGTEELGVFALGLTIVFLTQSIQESVITTPYTLFSVRYRGEERKQYRGSCLLSHFVLSGVAFVLLLGTGLIMYLVAAPEWLTCIVLSTSLIVPAWLLREMERRFLLAEFNLPAALLISVGVAAIQLISLVAMWYFGHLTVATAFLSVFIANALAAGIWLAWNFRLFQFSVANFWQTVERNWQQGKWLSASKAVSSIGTQAIPWIVVANLGMEATGIFAACDSVLRFANPVIVALTNIVTPSVALAFVEGGRAHVRSLVVKTSVLMFVLMTIFCVVIAVFGEALLHLLLGAVPAGAGDALVVLTLATAAARLSLGPSHGLMVLERTDVCLRADTLECVVKLAAALSLVGMWGVMGAAAADLAGGVTLTIVMTVAYLKVDNHFDRPPLADPANERLATDRSDLGVPKYQYPPRHEIGNFATSGQEP